MSYYERSVSFYRGLEIIDLLEKDDINPVLVGETFLENQDVLRLYSPGSTEPNFAALTAKVVGELGSGIFYKYDFDKNEGINNREVELLLSENFDGKLAQALVHLALFRYKEFDAMTFGTTYENTDQHLIKATEYLQQSLASDKLKNRPKFILELLNEKYSSQ